MAIILVSIIAFFVIVGTAWDPISLLVCSLTSAEDKKVLVNAELSDDEIVPDEKIDNIQVESNTAQTKPDSIIGIYGCEILKVLEHKLAISRSLI